MICELRRDGSARTRGDGLDGRLMTICLAASLALAACASSRAGTSAGGSDVPPTPSTVVSSAAPSGEPPSSAAPSAPSAPVATAKIVVTPVTEGRASPGWTVTPEPQTTIYCGEDAEPSPGALAPEHLLLLPQLCLCGGLLAERARSSCPVPSRPLVAHGRRAAERGTSWTPPAQPTPDADRAPAQRRRPVQHPQRRRLGLTQGQPRDVGHLLVPT